MVLSDVDIIKEIKKGRIIINPPVDQDIDISPSALDVHLGTQISKAISAHESIHRAIDVSHPDIAKVFEELYLTEDIPETGYNLQPQSFVLSTIKERLKLCSTISARIEGTSTLARFGLTIHNTAPTVHATYLGNLKLEICNHGSIPIILKPGMKIAQIVFEYLKTPSERSLQSAWQGK